MVEEEVGKSQIADVETPRVGKNINLEMFTQNLEGMTPEELRQLQETLTDLLERVTRQLGQASSASTTETFSATSTATAKNEAVKEQNSLESYLPNLGTATFADIQEGLRRFVSDLQSGKAEYSAPDLDSAAVVSLIQKFGIVDPIILFSPAKENHRIQQIDKMTRILPALGERFRKIQKVAAELITALEAFSKPSQDLGELQRLLKEKFDAVQRTFGESTRMYSQEVSWNNWKLNTTTGNASNMTLNRQELLDFFTKSLQ